MHRIIMASLALLLLSSCTLTGSKDTPSVTPPSENVQARIPSPTQGSGKHTLTIFADFQCPACIAFNNMISPIFESYANSGYLLITYKQFPLTMHKNAERDAIAALCGAEQGKYIDYKKALYKLEESKAGATVTDTDRVSAGNGILDTDKLKSCLASDTYLSQVRAEIKEGEMLGVGGTPTVYFDGKKLDNSVFRDLGALRTIMDRWLEIPAASTGTGQ